MVPTVLLAQNENSLSVKVNGEEFSAKPRKVKMRHYAYLTSNTTKPETMLRVWLADFKGNSITESGTYLVVNADNPPSKKEMKAEELVEKYEGYAAIRYVVETKSPRMSYHVGDSQNNNETIEVKNTGDGFIELTFNVELAGTHWKEKNAATIVGGVGRFQSKLEDKALSKATGFDWNIDPEGNGYKKLKETDTIELSNGKMIVKID